MNKEQPIKGWIKGLPDDLTKMYFIRNIQTKHGGMAYVQEIDGNENIEYLDETPIQSGEERWISVGDRLPKKDQKVIVVQNPKTTATRDSLYAVFDGEKFQDVGFSYDGIHLGLAHWSDIILWQPLPKPPSSEQKVQ